MFNFIDLDLEYERMNPQVFGHHKLVRSPC